MIWFYFFWLYLCHDKPEVFIASIVIPILFYMGQQMALEEADG